MKSKNNIIENRNIYKYIYIYINDTFHNAYIPRI